MGVGEDASWEQIGVHVEKEVRGGIANLIGTTPDADWAAIGQTVDQKVRAFLQNLFAKPTARKDDEDLVDPWE